MINTCPECGSKLPLSLHFHLVRKHCPNCHSTLVYKRNLRILLAIIVVILLWLAKGNVYLYPVILVITFVFQPLISIFIGYDVYEKFNPENLLGNSKGYLAIFLLYSIGIIFMGGYYFVFSLGLTASYRLILLALINLTNFYIFQTILIILIKFDLVRKIVTNPKHYFGYILTWLLMSSIVLNGVDIVYQAAMRPYLKLLFIIFGLLSLIFTTTQYLFNKSEFNK
jgi:hypothetical protein